MRIISGKYRGRVLASPKNNDVRPTTDMIKESVFNIVQNDINNCAFLDLFAGSGAIGIEALSRGASNVVFVDKSRDSLKIVQENLDKIGEKCTIINSDYAGALARLKGQKFDIIYLDPPFENTNIDIMLQSIKDNDILSSEGIVIYESLYTKEEKKLNSAFELKKNKKYGTISIEIYALAK